MVAREVATRPAELAERVDRDGIRLGPASDVDGLRSPRSVRRRDEGFLLGEVLPQSASSLHHHFRQLTAMSPLQFQKWLRLNEGFDAASAAFTVGDESASQFSREYARLFGAPPKRDVAGLRRKVATTRSPFGVAP